MSVSIPAPTAYPHEGVYDAPQMVTLLCTNPSAEIHYTLDDSQPSSASPSFDPYRLIPMVEFGQEAPHGKFTFTIHAIAQVGDLSSDVSTFTYHIEPRNKNEYVSQELAPGLHMICDFENDKMFLVVGSHRALLIDCGMGEGDLRGFIETFTADLPLDVVITHGHPDHISRIVQFQEDCQVYMHPADISLTRFFADRLHYLIDTDKIKQIDEGSIIDLGNRALKVYHLPGHSQGSIVLFDEDNGILFAGDAIGSNRPTIVDALWLQMSNIHISEYLSNLQNFRTKVGGKVKLIYSGHNDTALIGEAYLDHLQTAAQRLVDEGLAALKPSPRPHGVWQVVSGDRLTDPNWAAINVDRNKY